MSLSVKLWLVFNVLIAIPMPHLLDSVGFSFTKKLNEQYDKGTKNFANLLRWTMKIHMVLLECSTTWDRLRYLRIWYRRWKDDRFGWSKFFISCWGAWLDRASFADSDGRNIKKTYSATVTPVNSLWLKYYNYEDFLLWKRVVCLSSIEYNQLQNDQLQNPP